MFARPIGRAIFGGGPVFTIEGYLASLAAQGIQSLYYDFTVPPASLLPSGLSPFYKDAIGGACAAGDTIQLATDRSQAAAIGAELLVNGGFGADTDWTKGSGWSITGGKAVRIPDAAITDLSQALGASLVSGGLYRHRQVISDRTAGTVTPRLTGGATLAGTGITANGQDTQFLAATAAHTTYAIRAAASSDHKSDDASLQRIAGNHALQGTSGSRPTLNAGGWATWDGVDDYMASPLVPASEMTIAFCGRATPGATDVYFLGARPTSNNRCAIGIDTANKKLIGQWGVTTGGTITGGGNINDTTVVGMLRANSAKVELILNGALVYSNATGGTVSTAVPLSIGCFNADGTPANFLPGSIFRVVAIRQFDVPVQQISRALGAGIVSF